MIKILYTSCTYENTFVERGLFYLVDIIFRCGAIKQKWLNLFICSAKRKLYSIS